MKIKLIVILYLSITTFYAKAQNCESLREQAMKLDNALTKKNPDTYYKYAEFLAKQKITKTGCINKGIVETFISHLATAASLGHYRSVTRLPMIYAYGLYDKPVDPKKAYLISKLGVDFSISKYKTSEAQYRKHGWIPLMLTLKYAKSEEKEGLDNEYLQKVFKQLLLKEPLLITKSDKGSDKKARIDYYKTISKIYLKGYYGIEKNVSRGLKYAYKVDRNYGYRAYKEYVENAPKDNPFCNPAAQLFLASHSQKVLLPSSAVSLYNSHTYYLNEKKINTFNDFKKYYSEIKASVSSILYLNYKDYPTLQSKWNLIKESNLKDPRAYKNWKFLPREEQKVLFEKALNKKSDLNYTKRFQIFKANVENGETEALLSLAKSYLTGKGVNKNGLKAIKYFNEAYKVSNLKTEAAFNMALLYDAGEVVDQNWELAASYYKISTDFSPVSYRNIGEMHLFGVGGLSKDISLAKEYFKKATDLGDKKAKMHLGVLSLLGKKNEPYSNKVFSVVLKNNIPFKPRIIRDNKISHTIKFKVKENSNSNFVQFFIGKPKFYESPYPSIRISTYNPSSGYKSSGEHEVIVYPNTTVPYRDIGVFFIQAIVNDKGREIFMGIPEAICYYPEID